METPEGGAVRAPVRRPSAWHLLTHRFRNKLWENTDHLPVPGYLKLYRQRCTCGETRVADLA